MDREQEAEESVGGEDQPEAESSGSLHLQISDEESEASSIEEPPEASSSIEKPPELVSYWLAQYFTEETERGICLMAVKYPAHLPKEKVLKAAEEVRAGDSYAAKDIPLVIKMVSNPLAQPGRQPATRTTDWTVKYEVYDSPTSRNSKTVRLNYSSVFTEDEVRADAKRAVANHEHTVPDSLVISRVDDRVSSMEYSENELYPILEDKDWLEKMTRIEEAPRRSQTEEEAGPSEKNPSPQSSTSKKSKKVMTPKARGSKRKASDVSPGPSQTEEEEEEAGPSQKELSPQPSTSKKSKKATTSAKERFKGKVFQVKDAT